jgi:DNA-binding NtrC family response regulator
MSISHESEVRHFGGHRPKPVMVLLADDDPQVRHVCSMALTREGLSVKVVPNGGDAWRALELAEYDLLITDNDMPGLTGVEIIGRLRSAHRETPVVLISGTLSAEGLCRDARFPECAFLLKPFAPDHLLKLVRGFLSPGRSANQPPANGM